MELPQKSSYIKQKVMQKARTYNHIHIIFICFYITSTWHTWLSTLASYYITIPHISILNHISTNCILELSFILLPTNSESAGSSKKCGWVTNDSLNCGSSKFFTLKASVTKGYTVKVSSKQMMWVFPGEKSVTLFKGSLYISAELFTHLKCQVTPRM